MNEWQPIETAPTNGTAVLVWSAGVGEVTVCWSWGDEWENYEGLYGKRKGDEPTHWMPLPSPPQGVASGA